MEFKERLKAVIGDSTVNEFAALLEESPQRIKDVLRGQQKPPADLLVKIQTRLGVDLNWLLVGGERQPPALLSVREATLIENYRAAAEDGRRAIEQTGAAVQKPALRDKRTKSKAA